MQALPRNLRAMVRVLVTGALTLSWGASVAHAADVEAKRDGVEVYSDATNKSSVVGKLAKGEALAASERKGMFWQVKTKDGQAGFVSVLAVLHKADSGTDLAKAVKNVVNQGRTADGAGETRARSAVMGVRGLRDDDNVGNAADIRPNLRAVYQMEDKAVSTKKVQKLGDDVMKEIVAKAGAK